MIDAREIKYLSVCWLNRLRKQSIRNAKIFELNFIVLSVFSIRLVSVSSWLTRTWSSNRSSQAQRKSSRRTSVDNWEISSIKFDNSQSLVKQLFGKKTKRLRQNDWKERTDQEWIDNFDCWERPRQSKDFLWLIHRKSPWKDIPFRLRVISRNLLPSYFRNNIENFIFDIILKSKDIREMW